MTQYVQTEGWLLSSRPAGEHDLVLTFLTREGVVTARAQSARKESSTLRMMLIPGYLLSLSFAHTQKSTRLTGATLKESYAACPQCTLMLSRAAALILRLSHGAGDPRLFDLVTGIVTYAPLLTEQEDIVALECIQALRILATLGYASPRAFETLSLDLIHEAREKRALYVKKINESLAQSHL